MNNRYIKYAFYTVVGIFKAYILYKYVLVPLVEIRDCKRSYDNSEASNNVDFSEYNGVDYNEPYREQ